MVDEKLLKMCQDYIYAVFLCMITDSETAADNYRIKIHLKMLEHIKKNYGIEERELENLLHNLNKYIGLPILRRGDNFHSRDIEIYGRKLYEKIMEMRR